MPNDRINLNLRTRIVGEHRHSPTERLERHFFDRRFRQKPFGLRNVLIAHYVPDVKTIGRNGPTYLWRILVPIVKVFFYIFQIRFGFIKHAVGYFEALRFRQCQSMCDVYGQERIFIPFPVTLPKSKAAVTSLSRLQYLDIACEIFIKRFRRRHVLRFEGIQHVAHRRDRDHS